MRTARRSVFVHTIEGYLTLSLGTDDNNFLEHTTEICRSQDTNTITAVVELLCRINDIRLLPVMDFVIDTAIKSDKTLAASASSIDNNNILQTVVHTFHHHLHSELLKNKHL